MTPQRRMAERLQPASFEAPATKAARKLVYAPPEEDARKLQARAEAWVAGRALDQEAAVKDKWSARRTLVLVIGASTVLWGGIAMAGWLLVSSF
jgi:hypothetical protein